MYTRLLVPPTDGKCKTGLAASHFTAVHVCTVCTTPLPGPFQTYRCKPGLAQTWRHPSKHTGVLLHLYAAHSSANTPCGMHELNVAPFCKAQCSWNDTPTQRRPSCRGFLLRS